MWGQVAQSGSKGWILGEFQHSLDDKGRLAIPAKYRVLFDEGAVVTRGFEPCLYLFPTSEWEAWAGKLAALSITQAEVRQVARHVFSGAATCELDKLGRINVPAYLRDYASLGAEAALAGVGTRFEIWERGNWTSNRTVIESSGQALADRLADLGI